MNRPYFYLFLLCLLAVITYLDRVCISVAGPRMQDALHISPEQWGWVGTVFLLGYGIFEIPGGHLGDRVGARRILTRIVLWWSVFTALTGMVSSYPVLLGVRFLFGAGEAGAYPNGSVAISNWFSAETRGRAFGLFMMSGQIGGALSPLLVVPMQEAFGWPISFFAFGSLGVLWSIVWFWQYRDRPVGATPVPATALTGGRTILRNPDIWAITAVAFAYFYSLSFFQTWFHTYLVRGRGFSEHDLSLSSLPFFFGAAANLVGGLTCDWLAPRIGLKWSRRGVGMVGLFVSAVSMICAIFAANQLAIIICLTLVFVGITFQQPGVFAACLDMGGMRGGTVAAFMNTGAQAGGAVSSVVFGYIVKATGSYETPLIPMAALLVVAMLLWGKVDVTAQRTHE